MQIAAIIELLLQVLPMLANDGEALAAALNTASTAVSNANAAGDVVQPEDWAALDSLRAQAEAAWQAASKT